MRFVLSTPEFVYAGLPRPGFPLLLDDHLNPLSPFHEYLKTRLLDSGIHLDSKTWEAYGRRLWDYASFLHANDLKWDQPFDVPGQSVMTRYRDWSVSLRLKSKTINSRLRIVAAMYEWALERQMIPKLPYSYREKTRRGVEHDLSHVTRGIQASMQPSLFLDEWEEEPAFLSAEQLYTARQRIRFTSQRLLFDLMARVGLRNEEARTFPVKYVVDSTNAQSVPPRSPILVKLDPRDMDIKFDKPRIVEIPITLMEDMHVYTLFERRRLLSVTNKTPTELILTKYGTPYTKDGAITAFSDLSVELGFRIRPLMLRHSYAIHMLLLLRGRPEIKVEPLMRVRDLLGHEHVQNTMVYLKQIDRLLGSGAMRLVDEFDKLFGLGSNR